MKHLTQIIIILLLNYNWIIEVMANHTVRHCNGDYDCKLQHEFCVNHNCRCDNNYRLEGDECVYFKCYNDSECQEYDPNLVCDSMSCLCDVDYQYDRETRLCRSVDNKMLWLLVLIVLPLALVVLFCFYCYRMAKSREPVVDENNLNEIQAEPQTPQSPQLTPKIIITAQSYNDLENFVMTSPKLQRFMPSNKSL